MAATDVVAGSLTADPDATYDEVVEIDLSALEPLAAAPHMPDRMVRIADLEKSCIACKQQKAHVGEGFESRECACV